MLQVGVWGSFPRKLFCKYKLWEGHFRTILGALGKKGYKRLFIEIGKKGFASKKGLKGLKVPQGGLLLSNQIWELVEWDSRGVLFVIFSLQWRHIERNGVSDHRRPDCLLNRLFRCKSKKTTTLRVTALCDGNLPMTGGCSSQITRKMFPFDKRPHVVVDRYRLHP